MTKSSPKFTTAEDIKTVANLLMGLCNIAPGRDLVWLLNDGVSNDNKEAIERWLRAEVWQRQQSGAPTGLAQLKQALTDHLQAAPLET